MPTTVRMISMPAVMPTGPGSSTAASLASMPLSRSTGGKMAHRWDDLRIEPAAKCWEP